MTEGCHLTDSEIAYYALAPQQCPFTFGNSFLTVSGPRKITSLSYLLGGGILLDVSHLGWICKQSLDKVKKAYQTGLGVVESQLTQKLPCHQEMTHI